MRSCVLRVALLAACGASVALGQDGAAPVESRTPAGRLPTSSHTVQEVQGTGRRSPLAGQSVTDVVGVVTGVSPTGFTIQAPDDGDLATSDALLVFTGPRFERMPAVGDRVAVSGKVTEWAGRSAEPGAPTQTELERPTAVRVLASGQPLPAAVVLGASGRMPPVRLDAAPAPLDAWESLEHMRVELHDAVVVGPTERDELFVIPDGGAGYPGRTPRGGVLLASADAQACPGLISVVAAPGQHMLAATVGDRIARIEGLLVPDAGRAARVVPTRPLEGHVDGGLPRAPTSLVSDEEHVTIGSWNVENFSVVQAGRPAALARGIVGSLRSPAILALQEVQDDDGPGAGSTVVTSDATCAALCSAVAAAGGPRYEFTYLPPVADQEGGAPGGNIRVVFLWDPARVGFEPRGAARNTVPNRIERRGAEARIALNPGRVEPQDPAFDETRRTLAAEFRFHGRPVVVLNSHLRSRRSDSEAQRVAQGSALNRFVRELVAADPALTVLSVGDCNDFEFRPALAALAGRELTILTSTLPPGQRYSYVYQGSSQALDHALLGGPLRAATSGVELEYVHICAEYPEGSRLSDHDPMVVRLRLP